MGCQRHCKCSYIRTVNIRVLIHGQRPLKLEELRQALTAQYQNEGHTLLCPDGSFPYSDKDIELVCGSLVHIRNGTLQVVHLTVKEYIQSCSGPDHSYLPMEADSHSSQLATTCLSFLGSNYTQATSDSGSSKVHLQQLRTDAPFIEYAATFWMFHLTHSEAQDSAGVCKQFCKTFNSATTFCWMEMYLALHPRNLPDFFFFLDAIRNWIGGLGQDCHLLEDSNASFIMHWCGAVEQVLREYGLSLIVRPYEIHYINLSFAFTASKLSELYDKFGNINAREESSRFEVHCHPPDRGSEMPSHRRLQGGAESYGGLGSLFFYDSRREVYIWSPGIDDTHEMTLFVQSATDGKLLRPVKYQAPFENASFRDPSKISAYDLSKDGTLLLIVVLLGGYLSQLTLTLAWQIEECLDFSKGLNAAPWARLKFEQVANSGCHRWKREMCIAFRSDGGVCTPAGLIDSALKSVCPSEADIVGAIPGAHEHQLFYSGNGEFLFIVELLDIYKCAWVIKKLTWPKMEKLAEIMLEPFNLRGRMEAVSPSGRYLVFQEHQWGSDPDDLRLLDTLSGNCVAAEKLSLSGFFQVTSCHFSDDEREVNMLFASLSTLEMVTYAGLPNNAYLKSRETLENPYSRIGRDGSAFDWISDDHNHAIKVSPSGMVVQVKFGDKVELLDKIETIDDGSDEPASLTCVLSRAGDRLAHLEISKHTTCLQIFQVANAGKKLRHLEFDDAPCLRGDLLWPGDITMSPDLSLLLIGTNVYDLRLPDDQVTSRPLETVKPPSADDCECVVSSTNAFIAYVPYEDHPQLDVFRLDTQKSSWVRVQPSWPEDRAYLSAQFHPSLPLIAMLYSPITSESDSYMKTGIGATDIPLHVAIIDLNTGNIREVDVLDKSTSLLVKKLEKKFPLNCVKLLTFRQSFCSKRSTSVVVYCVLDSRDNHKLLFFHKLFLQH